MGIKEGRERRRGEKGEGVEKGKRAVGKKFTKVDAYAKDFSQQWTSQWENTRCEDHTGR